MGTSKKGKVEMALDRTFLFFEDLTGDALYALIIMVLILPGLACIPLSVLYCSLSSNSGNTENKQQEIVYPLPIEANRTLCSPVILDEAPDYRAHAGTYFVVMEGAKTITGQPVVCVEQCSECGLMWKSDWCEKQVERE